MKNLFIIIYNIIKFNITLKMFNKNEKKFQKVLILTYKLTILYIRNIFI